MGRGAVARQWLMNGARVCTCKLHMRGGCKSQARQTCACLQRTSQGVWGSALLRDGGQLALQDGGTCSHHPPCSHHHRVTIHGHFYALLREHNKAGFALRRSQESLARSHDSLSISAANAIARTSCLVSRQLLVDILMAGAQRHVQVDTDDAEPLKLTSAFAKASYCPVFLSSLRKRLQRPATESDDAECIVTADGISHAMRPLQLFEEIKDFLLGADSWLVAQDGATLHVAAAATESSTPSAGPATTAPNNAQVAPKPKVAGKRQACNPVVKVRVLPCAR